MTPSPTPSWSEMLMALGLGTLGGRMHDTTRAVPVPTGLHAELTSSIAPQYALVPEAVPDNRAERARALRGKYRGRLPTVDEYLRLKHLEQD